MADKQQVEDIVRQTDYLEKQDGQWRVLHEHSFMAQGWDGRIDE